MRSAGGARRRAALAALPHRRRDGGPGGGGAGLLASARLQGAFTMAGRDHRRRQRRRRAPRRGRPAHVDLHLPVPGRRLPDGRAAADPQPHRPAAHRPARPAPPRPGFYSGTATFVAPVRCAGRRYAKGEAVPFTITVRVTAAQTLGAQLLATRVRAFYRNPRRIGLTQCVSAPAHDAARYTGTLASSRRRAGATRSEPRTAVEHRQLTAAASRRRRPAITTYRHNGRPAAVKNCCIPAWPGRGCGPGCAATNAVGSSGRRDPRWRRTGPCRAPGRRPGRYSTRARNDAPARHRAVLRVAELPVAEREAEVAGVQGRVAAGARGRCARSSAAAASTAIPCAASFIDRPATSPSTPARRQHDRPGARRRRAGAAAAARGAPPAAAGVRTPAASSGVSPRSAP